MPVIWGEADHSVMHPGNKPKRPLSAYNFFFQLERERIIKIDEKERSNVVTYTIEDVARIAMLQQQKAKDEKPKEKRSHRTTHGKIGFGDLARTIATNWKKLDESSKAIFDGSAEIEKGRYMRELNQWNKQQKKWNEATVEMAPVVSNPQQIMVFEGSYRVVTPTRLPKQTVRYAAGEPPEIIPNEVMTAFRTQQKTLNESSFTQTRNAGQPKAGVSSMVHQQQHGAGAQSKSPINDWNSRFDECLRFSTGMMVPCGQWQLPYGAMRSRGTCRAMGGMTHVHDMRSHQMYHTHENEDYNTTPNGQIVSYEYDDLMDATYPMAFISVPQPHPHAFHRRMMINQRRMRMMMMMQQHQLMAGAPHHGSYAAGRNLSAAVMPEDK